MLEQVVIYQKNSLQQQKIMKPNHFHYDHSTNSLDCKLLTKNPYVSYFKQVYPTIINEHELT